MYLTRLVGVGHSLGGHLIARAAAHAPERFKHLILIDPVIMSPDRYAQVQQSSLDLKTQDHPVSRRKNQWRDAREMYERFKGRAPFDTWQPAALRDDCDYALRPADEEALPNCQEVYLPNLNHFIPMQDPALVACYIQAAQ